MEKLYSVGGQKAEENKKTMRNARIFHQPRKKIIRQKPRTNQNDFR